MLDIVFQMSFLYFGLLGCINRDNNDVQNMKEIVKQYFIDKTRPMKFRRSTQLDKLENIINENAY